MKSSSAISGLLSFLLCCILVGITLSVFRHNLNFGFFDGDDFKDIQNNTALTKTTISGINELFIHPSRAPLKDFVNMVNYAVAGRMDPKIFHWGNNILHALAVACCYLFLYLLTKRYIFSFAVALLFALHPANINTVAWVSARSHIISTIFTFLSLIFYLLSNDQRLITGTPNWKQRFCYVFSIFLFSAGLLSYMTIFPLPLVFFVYEIFVNNTHDDIKKRCVTGMRRLFPFIVVQLIYIFLIFQKDTEGLFPIWSLYGVTALYKIIGIFFNYVDRSIYPIIGASAERLFLPSYTDLFYYGSRVMGVILLLNMVRILYKWERWIAVAPAILIGFLIPGNIFLYKWEQFSVRYLYMSSLGMAMIVVGTVEMIFSAQISLRKRIAIIISTMFLILLLLTIHLNQDGFTKLVRSTDQAFKNNKYYKAVDLSGSLLASLENKNDPGKNILQYELYNNLDSMYFELSLDKKDFGDLVNKWEKRDPKNTLIRCFAARFYAERGNKKRAQNELVEILKMPSDGISFGLAHIYYNLNDEKRLEELCYSWHKRENQNTFPVLFLTYYYAEHGELDEARNLFEELERVSPDYLHNLVYLSAEIDSCLENESALGDACCSWYRNGPRREDAFYCLVRYYAKHKKTKEGRDKIMQLQREFSLPAGQLSVLNFMIMNEDEMKRNKPDSDGVQYFLELIKYLVELQKPDEARYYLAKARRYGLVKIPYCEILKSSEVMKQLHEY
jgi:hypothetical protein